MIRILKKNEILEMSFDFSLNMIDFKKFLKAKREFVLSKQILKSGTSIGAKEAREPRWPEKLSTG
ncbi:four helix bundle protein [Caldithrix abyssi]|nr:four helix bundle protein [Caldithrix abyssi]